MRSTRWLLAGLIVAGATALALPLAAQPAGGGAGGAGGGRGNFNFTQMMVDNVKRQLAVSDEDWKALEPKVEKVVTLQRDARGGGMARMGRGGRGGGGGAGGGAGAADNAPQTDVAQKAADLQKVLDDKDAKPEDIKAKLSALREARAKAVENLKKAQAELTELLTQRQEAMMVEMSILE